VKFLFPNSYHIYMHDTPARQLFARDQRAFSHGCIRLAEPRLLAEYLLRNDSTWTAERMTEAMLSGKETYVRLRERPPVMIVYFTSWVDRNGLLNFREDVYGHDRKLAAELFR
ncbi:MAG: L,D-transpeptidase family protein, partial [Thioalkalivibrio sp.]|nr:L,D-transpeptidase family protein [Thioalkalivibrio sp.]